MSDRRVISTWLAAEEHEAWSKRAAEARLSVSSLTRQAIRSFLKKPGGPAAGTPSAHQDEPKTSELKVRLTRAELSALSEMAEKLGVRRSTVLRSILQAGLSELPLTSPAELDRLAAATWELRKVGVNLNQIAHRLNESAKAGQPEQLDPDLFRQLVDALHQRIDRLTFNTDNVLQRSIERGQKIREKNSERK